MNTKQWLLGVIVAAGAACTDAPQTKPVAHSTYVPQEYQLVWNDEFDSNGCTLPDTTEWRYETGGGGWGNAEQQYYVPAVHDTDTVAFLNDGILHIRVVMPREPVEGHKYLSARMNTRTAWKYGYFEARMKLPKGVGTWPAFWMLPEEFDNWPLDGEIDIMEHVGSHPDSIHISTHTQRYNHSIGTQQTAITVINGVQDDFHVYGLEWTPQEIKGYIDGILRFRFQNDGRGDKETWPFDAPFIVKLNQAVGGFMGGLKGVDDACFPATFQIDYVRVYQKERIKNE